MKLLFLPLLFALAMPAYAATPGPMMTALPPIKAATAKPAPAKPVAAATAPVTPEALLEQARDARLKGETELAMRLTQSAIVADPARPATYVALGDLYAAAGQGEFARSFYDAALDIDPADAGAKAAVAALGTAKATAANSP